MKLFSCKQVKYSTITNKGLPEKVTLRKLVGGGGGGGFWTGQREKYFRLYTFWENSVSS